MKVKLHRKSKTRYVGKTVCKKELTLVSLWIRSNANGLERLNIMKNFLDTENTIIYNIKNIDTNTLLCGK